jgi:hypothetical protein
LDISNRSLILLLVITLVLVGAAAALTVGMSLGGSTIEPPPPVVVQATVQPNVVRSGGKKIDVEGPLVVEVDKSLASPPASALLTCDMYKSERPFWEGGMGFPSIPFGNCTVLFSGTSVPYGPVFPGDRLVCSVAETKTVCTGGIAADKAGTLSVSSALPGTLEIDGEDLGALPLSNLKVKVGKRALVVHVTDGRTLSWALNVQPEEQIDVSFPDPTKPTQTGISGSAPPPPPPAGSPAEAALGSGTTAPQ